MRRGRHDEARQGLTELIDRLGIEAESGAFVADVVPERVALERRFGGSIWEGLLHNPQLTPREVLRMAKSASLPVNLVNLIVANKAWLADAAIQGAAAEAQILLVAESAGIG